MSNDTRYLEFIQQENVFETDLAFTLHILCSRDKKKEKELIRRDEITF